MNKRQLNGWVKIVDKLSECVVQRMSKRVARGGGRCGLRSTILHCITRFVRDTQRNIPYLHPS